MKDLRLILGTLGFVGFLTIALAKDADHNPHWFSPQEVDALIATEPPPPAAGSDAEKIDLQKVIDAQNTRTPARIAEAKQDDGYSVTLFTHLEGPGLTAVNDPITFRFFDRLNVQIAKVVGDSKEHWHLLRPYLGHPDIIHPIFTARGYSYPSGHATHSYAFATILGVMFPDRAQAFLNRAHAIAQSRVDAGVHYPSDIREGEIVGKEIAKELLAKPEFQREMQAAEAEVAAKK